MARIPAHVLPRLATSWDHDYIGPMDLPTNRPLTDDELANAIALAITDDRQNPGQDLPFQANVNVMLARLGKKDSADFRTANAGPPGIDARIHELCWRWILGGLLVPSPSGAGFVPTEAGRKYLEESGADLGITLTTGGLARTLQERCPGIDDITLTYGRLAQQCFLSGQYEAAVVLLGAASETMLLSLAQVTDANMVRLGISISGLASHGAVHRLDALRKIFEDHGKTIKQALGAAGCDARWVSELPRLLGNANAIRLTRNDAGHPVRLVARRDEALGLLTMFPQVAEAVFVTADAIGRIP